ncbi:unnamed protein product [Pleuronectes platessa]|uniref:Uncharacterized protein n=1 Tax=Pleuronectes platessa TaxID=8262 RepID=A0A9N7YY65_PLEPL|nr:unnamed protein product [Pleuronectes platessa]
MLLRRSPLGGVLGKDTLVSDPQVTAALLSTVLQEPHIHTGCLQVMLPVGQTSQVTAVGRCKAEYDDEMPEVDEAWSSMDFILWLIQGGEHGWLSDLLHHVHLLNVKT